LSSFGVLLINPVATDLFPAKLLHGRSPIIAAGRDIAPTDRLP